MSFNDYKEYCQIEIDLITIENKGAKFININKKEDEKYYHIYFNNNEKEEETKKYYLNKNDKSKNIKIKIDYPIKSFYKLFYNCEQIESINFKNFKRNNINNISFLF